MAKKKAKLTIKPKKKWFMAVAPEVYKNVEVGEIAAFEPQELVGRAVEVSLMQLTGSPKDQNKKIYLKIKDTRGEKALTNPWKILIQEGFIQRASRRFRERIITIVKTKSKDGKAVKAKLLTLVVAKLPKALGGELTKKIELILNEKISKTKSDDLFIPAALDKMAVDLKKELRAIYPVNKIVFWKLTVV